MNLVSHCFGNLTGALSHILPKADATDRMSSDEIKKVAKNAEKIMRDLSKVTWCTSDIGR